MIRTIFVIYICIVFSFYSLAQNNPLIYKAYISDNMNEWKQTIEVLEQKQKTDKDILDLINYQYGYIGWSISQKKIKEAELYMAKSEKHIQFLVNKKKYSSMMYAYKAAFVGFKINMSPYKAPLIGSDCFTYVNKAIEIDPLNPFAYLQLGNITYYSPEIFGGSKQKAIEHFLKAMRIMESQKSTLTNNWNYLSVLTAIIQAYIDSKDYKQAKMYCIKALTFEPKFQLVKNKLYPYVLKQLKNE